MGKAVGLKVTITGGSFVLWMYILHFLNIVCIKFWLDEITVGVCSMSQGMFYGLFMFYRICCANKIILASDLWTRGINHQNNKADCRNAKDIHSSYFNFSTQQHRCMTAHAQWRALVRHNAKLLTEIQAFGLCVSTYNQCITMPCDCRIPPVLSVTTC